MHVLLLVLQSHTIQAHGYAEYTIACLNTSTLPLLNEDNEASSQDSSAYICIYRYKTHLAVVCVEPFLKLTTAAMCLPFPVFPHPMSELSEWSNTACYICYTACCFHIHTTTKPSTIAVQKDAKGISWVGRSVISRSLENPLDVGGTFQRLSTRTLQLLVSCHKPDHSTCCEKKKKEQPHAACRMPSNSPDLDPWIRSTSFVLSVRHGPVGSHDDPGRGKST